MREVPTPPQPDREATELGDLCVHGAGTPLRCAAVLVMDGSVSYTDGAPSSKFMAHLEQRCDAQIMALEILSISVGLSTFARKLAGRKVIVWSDNTAAEAGSSSLVPPRCGYAARAHLGAGSHTKRECTVSRPWGPHP